MTMAKGIALTAGHPVLHLNPDDKGTRVDPEDSVVGLEDEQVRVRDFWRWAFSDLCDDDLKGWYAEWIVSILLGIRTERRRS